MRLEEDRSSWIGGESRLTVTTKLRDEARLLGVHSQTSDALLTMAMLEWRKAGEGLRVVMKTENPDVLDRQERGVAVDPMDASRVDTVCATKL